MTKRIAYQGTKAAYIEIAIEQFFGSAVESMGKVAFEDVFKSLDCEEVEFAAVPIENSLIGPIVENFDLFHRYKTSIIGELCLPITHCLVGQKNQGIRDIKKVFSHPKALAQCTTFFQAHPWIEAVGHFDTAGAALEIAKRQDSSLAAIGSRKTAEMYRLEILQENLEDNRRNTTRFLFLQKAPTKPLTEGKCSLLFTLKHIPGALSDVLLLLASQGFNLTQIVSRPIWEKPFEYLFFVDILFSGSDALKKILNLLEEKVQTLKLLGVYEPSK